MYVLLDFQTIFVPRILKPLKTFLDFGDGDDGKP